VNAQALPDEKLIAIVIGGDDEPGWNDCQQELTARVERGNLGCQRASIAILVRLWGEGQLSTGAFLERAEPVARLAAANGSEGDISTLAGVLSVRAELLRDVGLADLAHPFEVEALTLLGSIANESADEKIALTAAGDFKALAATFSNDAQQDAKIELFCRNLETEQQDEPEVAAFKRARGEK
jgi:hypothetical protein